MPTNALHCTWCVLFFVTWGLSGVLGMYGYSWDENRDTISSQEVKKQLDILTNEVIRLKEEVQELKGREITHNLQILSASRKALADGNVEYTVRYQEPKTNSPPSKAVWRRFEDYTFTKVPEAMSNKILNLPPGVRQTSIMTTLQNHTHLMLSFGSSKHWLTVYLNNDSEEVAIERDIETPVLDVSPKGDIVYSPGNNATLKITHPLENKKEGPGSGLMGGMHFRSSYILTKPSHTELMPDDKSLFNIEKEDTYFDKIELIMTLPTAIDNYSGILSFTAGSNKDKGLIRRVENNKEIVLRPSTQNGPFLKGMIYKDRRMLKNDLHEGGNDTVSFCEYGEKCYDYCGFYGMDLTSLELFKTVNGVTTSAHLERPEDDEEVYKKQGLVTITPAEESGPMVTYTCTARNAQGRSESAEKKVIFGGSVKILKNETGYEEFDNGTARIECTAKGLPLPRIRLECNGREVDQTVLFSLDDVIRVEATCNDVLPWSSFYCTAENEYYRSDSYRF